MNSSIERDLEDWARDWRSEPSAAVAPDVIRSFVMRRSRQLAAWAVVETATGVVAIVWLLSLLRSQTDGIDRLAMGLLLVLVAGALAFGWWNWRGALSSWLLTSQKRGGLRI